MSSSRVACSKLRCHFQNAAKTPIAKDAKVIQFKEEEKRRKVGHIDHDPAEPKAGFRERSTAEGIDVCYAEIDIRRNFFFKK